MIFIHLVALIILVLWSMPTETLPSCHRSMTYDEIRDLLEASPCATIAQLDRMKRNDGDTASSNHIYALQTTVNDHRTMIDDHRRMIQYLMNTTVNITQFNDYFREHHSQTNLIWKSWRDVSIVLLLVIVIVAISSVFIRRLHPIDLLTNFLVRRHQIQQQRHQPRTPKSAIRDFRHAESDPSLIFSIEPHHPHHSSLKV